MQQNSERPLFVVGAPRSGTTLLQLMLHAHPRIAIPPENRFVLPAYYARHRFGDLRIKENRRQLARFITAPRGTKFRDLGLDRRATRKAIKRGPPTAGSALGVVLRGDAPRVAPPPLGH